MRRHSTVLNKKCQIRNKREKRKSNERKVIAKKFGGKEIDKKKRNERMEKKLLIYKSRIEGKKSELVVW